ncbi:MAG: BMC domain-containing protein [Lachnospiraceae bacterium]|nr:BMC domain-containing protein [Lachnospiraceae bacterium]
MLQEIARTTGGDKARITRVRVPGKSIDIAHIIGVSSDPVYTNLALNIGFHAGDDPTGRAIGIMRLTPWESVVIAADMAVKNGNVDIGFMDRFCGSLIITGELPHVQSAMQGIVRFFSWDLHYDVCPITQR